MKNLLVILLVLVSFQISAQVTFKDSSEKSMIIFYDGELSDANIIITNDSILTESVGYRITDTKKVTTPNETYDLIYCELNGVRWVVSWSEKYRNILFERLYLWRT